MPQSLYTIQKNAEDLTRLRLISSVNTLVGAWDPVKKYSRTKFNSKYIDEIELRIFFETYHGDVHALEKSVIDDFATMYESVFLQLNIFYDELRSMHNEIDMDAELEKRSYEYGMPRIQIEAIESLIDRFQFMAKKYMRQIKSQVSSVVELREIQERLHAAIGYAEEAISELIKTLAKYFDLKRQRFDRNLKLLGAFTAPMGTIARLGSGLPG